MDTEDFFNNREQVFSPIYKATRLLPMSSTLNPWTEHQLVNPYLNSKSPAKSKANLKEANTRKKVLSLDQLKNNKIFLSFASKQITESNKIPCELPKLNIDKLMRDQSNKNRKTINARSLKNQLNSLPLYSSSPTIKKMNLLNYSSENINKQTLLPSVSRELNITRKIYLLENKLKTNATTPSPVKKPQRQEPKRQEDSDIRRLVEKQWSKKL